MEKDFKNKPKEGKCMAIDLTTLNTTEIIPQKVYNSYNSYKADQNKIRENWEEKKAYATDLIEESKKNGSYRESASLEGAGVIGITAGKGAYCNYSLDAFFRKDMPLLSDDNGNFTVGGATFTREELEECRAVMKASVDGIGCGIGKNTNIDYRNYAEMEIAAGGVRAYASENLTEKQAAVVNKAMQEYNDALIKLEKDTLERVGAVDITGSELSNYYGKAQPIPKEALDRIYSFNSNSKLNSGDVGTIQSATNEELINKIRDMFSKLDYSDSSSLDSVAEKYKELITPAKMSLGVSSANGYLSQVLNQDVSGFQNLFKNMMNVIRYRSIDFKL